MGSLPPVVTPALTPEQLQMIAYLDQEDAEDAQSLATDESAIRDEIDRSRPEIREMIRRDMATTQPQAEGERNMKHHAAVLAGLVKGYINEFENLEADAPVDAGCEQCTAYTVPYHLNKGLCLYHSCKMDLAAYEKALLITTPAPAAERSDHMPSYLLDEIWETHKDRDPRVNGWVMTIAKYRLSQARDRETIEALRTPAPVDEIYTIRTRGKDGFHHLQWFFQNKVEANLYLADSKNNDGTVQWEITPLYAFASRSAPVDAEKLAEEYQRGIADGQAKLIVGYTDLDGVRDTIKILRDALAKAMGGHSIKPEITRRILDQADAALAADIFAVQNS